MTRTIENPYYRRSRRGSTHLPPGSVDLWESDSNTSEIKPHKKGDHFTPRGDASLGGSELQNILDEIDGNLQDDPVTNRKRTAANQGRPKQWHQGELLEDGASSITQYHRKR